MAILGLVFTVYSFVGTGFSIAGGINLAIKKYCKTTAEDLFKKSFVKVVKQNASNFADQADPKTVEVDSNLLDKVITSLKDDDIVQLTQLNESEKIAKITTLFRHCIIVPNHQLTDRDFDHRIRPVVESVIVDFYAQLPFKQEAFNQIVLEFIQNNITNQDDAHTILTELSSKIDYLRNEVTQRLSEDIQAIKVDTENIKDDNKEIKQTTQATYDLVREVKSLIDINTSPSIETAVAKEHQAQIDNARNLLKSHKPTTSLELLETLKKRTWKDASDDLKYSILTNMAAAQFSLNNEKEAAQLLLEAFDFNREDERALSNRALAHLLLGETEYAADYARQTLDKNDDNTDAYVILVGISEEEETLDEVIDKVPDLLHDSPQIAYAISELAKQRENFEAAKRWGEIMLSQDQGNAPDFKAAFATILIKQVLEDNLAVGTSQLNDSQKKQLQRAIGLLTEAWNCIANTELRDYRADWIINRGIARFHLGELKKATEDLDTALDIEKSNPILIKNRALLAFECGEIAKAIDFLEKIQSAEEVPEAQIIFANLLFAEKQIDKAITKLNEFLQTDPSPELQEEAKRLLIKVYIANECFDKAREISAAMQDSSPMNILYLVDDACISSATGNPEEAVSRLKIAYNYVQDNDNIREKLELADQLYIHEQYKEATTLYEMLADTNLDSELTQWLIKSYYCSGEIGKALEICEKLREKYGLIENIIKIEVDIYEKIGNIKQAETLCEMYLDEFPDDADMQIRLGFIHFRLNNLEEIDHLLEKSFDLKNLNIHTCFQLAHLHQLRSASEKALEIMYETRRTHSNDSDAHLLYVGLYSQVKDQLEELLQPTIVQSGTAVCIKSSNDLTKWYILDKRKDDDYREEEIDIDHPLSQLLLGKVVGEKFYLQQEPISADVRQIVDIKSKYVKAFHDSFHIYPERFPGTPGLWTMTLSDSDEADDSANFQPFFDYIDRRHEDLIQIEKIYIENNLTIGAFTNLTGGNSLDTWGNLMNNPNLGIRCCIEEPEERRQAFDLLTDSNFKIVVGIVSLMTLHCLDAADIVVSTFGKLCITQSTIDELKSIISEREGTLSKHEGMTVRKIGNQYVKQIITPEETKHGIEYLNNIINWVAKNCEVLPCTAALQMNQLRRTDLNNMLQPHFLDTVLLASQPGHLLFSDDGRLRQYVKTTLNSDAGTNYQIDGVWTQVLLEHCVKNNLLDKADYDEMTIKLVCSRYYHTVFDANLLFQTAKRSNWKLSEPYNSFVLALGRERMNIHSALDVAVDFLFKLWDESISIRKKEFLTLGLLAGLTYGRNIHAVLNRLEYLIQSKHILFLPVENNILRQIQSYSQIYPLESNFVFLAEDDIRIKGTRVGIETVLYEYIHNNQTPEEIADSYYTLTLEQVYAIILYYLLNQEKIGVYLSDYLKYIETSREEYENDPPPDVVRIRELKAENQTDFGDSSPNTQQSSTDSTTSSSPKNEME